MFDNGYNGLLGLLILIGDVWAIIKSSRAQLRTEKNCFGQLWFCCCRCGA